MSSKASISVDLTDDSSEVTISGTYDNVINAICAGIKGLITHMMSHPKYKAIKEDSNWSDDEYEEELTYSVMLNIMDRLDNHYVLAVGKIGDEVLLNNTEEISTTEDNNDIDIDFDGFEQFLNNSNKADSNEQ